MREALDQQRDRLRRDAKRLVAVAVLFHDRREAGRMVDHAIAQMARERELRQDNEPVDSGV